MFELNKNKKSGLLEDYNNDVKHDDLMENTQLNKISNSRNTDPKTNIYKHKKKICLNCSWKILCLTSILTMSLVILILFFVIFFYSAPTFVQSTFNNANINIINGTIFNPTNSSISLNATIIISNTGFLDATLNLKSTKVTVTNDRIAIGTLLMPSINTEANKNTMLTISAELQITNKTQFQKSCKELLQNMDQKWLLSANKVILTVDTKTLGKMDYSVDINKELTLKGTNLYNFIASDFNVKSATNSTLTSVSNLHFISDSIFTFILPQTLMSIYYDDTYFGYAQITSSLSMKPGLNIISNQSLIIESYPSLNNQNLLNTFFSNYISGKNQKVKMRGPIASNTVIDDVFNEIIIALGYTKGMLAFGGLVTKASQQGWKVGSTNTYVRGAYSDFINPLNVPIKIINMSAVTYLQETIKYHVRLVVKEYYCEASEFAQLNIGPGMYKNNATKTWIDVASNGKTTYFNIASPPNGSKPGKCMDLYDFSCCFATLTAAYACKLNPGIQTKPSDGELSTDYIPLTLHANITILIDNQFEIKTFYRQPFFPLYFGYEVYDGFAEDLRLSCKRFTFK